eukprot:1188640-Prorocentrum_minimum.AAC.3
MDQSEEPSCVCSHQNSHGKPCVTASNPSPSSARVGAAFFRRPPHPYDGPIRHRKRGYILMMDQSTHRVRALTWRGRSNTAERRKSKP